MQDRVEEDIVRDAAARSTSRRRRWDRILLIGLSFFGLAFLALYSANCVPQLLWRDDMFFLEAAYKLELERFRGRPYDDDHSLTLKEKGSASELLKSDPNCCAVETSFYSKIYKLFFGYPIKNVTLRTEEREVYWTLNGCGRRRDRSGLYIGPSNPKPLIYKPLSSEPPYAE